MGRLSFGTVSLFKVCRWCSFCDFSLLARGVHLRLRVVHAVLSLTTWLEQRSLRLAPLFYASPTVLIEICLLDHSFSLDESQLNKQRIEIATTQLGEGEGAAPVLLASYFGSLCC
jgi:hypothetical protein